MSISRQQTNSPLEHKLKTLRKKIETLNRQIGKIIRDGQFSLQACREKLINICNLHGEIAASIHATAILDTTTPEEKLELFSEAKKNCEKAIEDLYYIRKSPSRDLIDLSNNIKQALRAIPAVIAEVVDEEMEVDIGSESEEKIDAMELDPPTAPVSLTPTPPQTGSSNFFYSSSSPLFAAFTASLTQSVDGMIDKNDIPPSRRFSQVC